MIYSLLVARASIGTAALALAALVLLHFLKPEVSPSRNMISQYALGKHGWVMALCFAAFGIASACLFTVLAARLFSVPGRIGLAFLLAASIGLVLAARFRMDPVSTPPERRSFAGKMHGVSFLIGVPSQILATLFVSLAVGNWGLIVLTAIIWLSLAAMITVMLKVGPGKESDPAGPERFLGLPNRLFMVGYGVWLMIAAWPLAR